MTLPLLRSLVDDQNGQDLVEYALLTSFVALAGIAAFEQLRAAIGTTYQAWNAQNNNLWAPPPPQP